MMLLCTLKCIEYHKSYIKIQYIIPNIPNVAARSCGATATPTVAPVKINAAPVATTGKLTKQKK